MNKYSRLLTIILCILLLMAPVSAIEVLNNTVDLSEKEENIKQERIDEIFAQIDELVMERKKLTEDSKYLKLNKEANYTDDIKDKLATIATERSFLEKELVELGMKKINPNNEEDIANLRELVSPDSTRLLSATSDEVGDHVEQLATFFSVYRYNGKRTINGTEYTYSYIRVVDDKNYDLYVNSMGTINMLNYKPSLLKDLLAYNLQYYVSSVKTSVVGAIFDSVDLLEYEWLAEWTIGNICTALNSLDPNTSVTQAVSQSQIYTSTVTSITQMTYYYIYMPQYPQWVLIGSRANNVRIVIDEVFHMVLNGKIYPSSRQMDHTFETGKTWYWYIDNFVKTQEPTHHIIGKYTLYGMDKAIYEFAPTYYYAPLAPLYK